MTRFGAFVEQLRQRHGALWHALVDHPFVQALGNGTLSRDCYAFYLRQDHIYLLDLSRALALFSARADDIEQMRALVDLLHTTLTTELNSVRNAYTELGLNAVELDHAQPTLVTSAYADALVRCGHEGRAGDLVAALLPCETGYVHIVDHLRAHGANPQQPWCRAWLQTYDSPDMRELARWFDTLMQQAADQGGPADHARWERLYGKSLRLEWLFFQAAWQQVSWPTASADLGA